LTSEVARPSAVDRPDRADGPDRPDRPDRPTRLDRPAIETATGRFEFEPHNCFACGSLNANGLQLDLHVEPGRCWTAFTLDRRFEGWEGIAHGGILCTILDEVMAWALVGEDNWGVTARMNVAFRRPVEVGLTVRAEGWIAQARRRVVDTAARIVDADTGDELATATGVYVAASPDRKRYLRERYAFRPVEATSEPPESVDAG
jgi:acyl-coenzyme A thioesterase PaaI-like protein